MAVQILNTSSKETPATGAGLDDFGGHQYIMYFCKQLIQPVPGGCLSEKSELLIFLLIDLGQTALALPLLVMAGAFEPYMTENLVSIPLQER